MAGIGTPAYCQQIPIEVEFPEPVRQEEMQVTLMPSVPQMYGREDAVYVARDLVGKRASWGGGGGG